MTEDKILHIFLIKSNRSITGTRYLQLKVNFLSVVPNRFNLSWVDNPFPPPGVSVYMIEISDRKTVNRTT